MEVPECNVCHVPLDEEDHQPRHLGCSHDACTSCVKALIKNGALECPMCRTVIKASKPDDFKINHGVVQVLRLFKGFKLSEKKPNEEGAVAITKEICRMHNHTADKRCISCKLSICVQCKELHTSDIGCEIQDYEEFLKRAKKEHKEKLEPTILFIRNKLSNIEIEKKRLEDEIVNLQQAGVDGEKVLKEIEEATATVDKANTSLELNASVHISTEWHQFAQIWCKKNTGTLCEILRPGREVVASKDINGKTSNCRMLFENGNMFLHCFRVNGPNISKAIKVVQYDEVQTWLPLVRDLVFLDLAICGEVKGRVTIRLRQDLPTYANYIPLLFTGEEGYSLLDLKCITCDKHNLGIEVSSVTKKIKKYTRDAKAGHKVAQGSILTFWEGNEINLFYIHHEQGQQPYDNDYDVFGQVESGLETVKLCRNHVNQSEVTVVDTGLVLKDDLLRNKPIIL